MMMKREEVNFNHCDYQKLRLNLNVVSHMRSVLHVITMF